MANRTVPQHSGSQQEPSLERDLEELRRLHAIDDSLIASLTASPEQAEDHIRFWRTTMWTVNGFLIAASLALLVWTARGLGDSPSILQIVAFILLSLLTLKVSAVLRRQRRALAKVNEIAIRHGLLDRD